MVQQRIPALLLTLLPPILLLTSLILSAIATGKNDWSYREIYDPSSTDSTPVSVGIEQRGPFSSSILTSSVANTTINGTETQQTVWSPSYQSTKKSSGLCDVDAQGSTRVDGPFFCQQLAISARLLYAGNALVAAALLVVLLLVMATLPALLSSTTGSARKFQRVLHRNHYRHHEHYMVPPNHSPAAYFGAIATLTSALAALSLLLGTIIAAHTFTVLQFPNGDYFSSGLGGDPTLTNHAGPWMLGRPAGMCAASAVLAGVAAYCTTFVWGGPSVGVLNSAEDGQSTVEEHVHSVHQEKRR